MIKIRLVLLLCVSFGVLNCVEARAKTSERYMLHWKTIQVSGPPYNTKAWDVWLWDSKRKRILWKRRLNNFYPEDNIHWSEDRRAVAVEGSADAPLILVWHEGFRLRTISDPIGGGYSMGCAWSPDNLRLLMRFGSSGDSTVSSGDLFCLRLKTWPNYKVYKLGRAQVFRWKNRKTAIFWEVDPNHNYGPNGDIPAPLIRHIWHAP